MRKRMTSLLLTLVMLLSLLPTTAFAASYAKISVNDILLGDNYYLKSNSATGSDYSNTEPSSYVAWYKNGVLTLKGYNGKGIVTQGVAAGELTVKLIGSNSINNGALESDNGGDITVTSDSSGTLSISKTTSGSNPAIGIETGLSGSYKTGNVTIKGNAKVTINMTHTGTRGYEKAYGIYAKENITISENASVDITCATPNNTTGGDHCNGLRADKNVTIDTNGTIKIDVTNAGKDENNGYSFGVYPMGTATLTKVGNMEVKWKKDASNSVNSGGAVYKKGTSLSGTDYAINEDETNCYVSYRKGTPYTVTVKYGTLAGTGVVSHANNNGNFLAGDTVEIKPSEMKGKSGEVIPFQKWTSEQVTFTDPTAENNSFNVPANAVTVTAKHSPFVGTPTFTPIGTASTEGTLTFKTKVTLGDGNESFALVKEAEVDNTTEYKSINPSTTSLSSPYEYSSTVNFNNFPAGNYYVAEKLNGAWYLSDPFKVDYTAAPATLTGITVKTAPDKVTYNEGESFDKTGMVIEATYSDSSKKDVTTYTYTPTGALTTANTTISISYTEGSVTKTCTQSITVNAVTPPTPATLTGISVKTVPDKVTYTEGESFDKTGMVIEATYSDSSKKNVTTYTYTPTGALTTSDTTITISYSEGSVTQTCTQAITVTAAPPTPAALTGISVKTAPSKVTYNEGDSFDATGMVIEATYSDSTKKDVTTYTYTPTGALTTSDTTISISYTEGSVTKTCTQTITVNAAPTEYTITFDVNGGSSTIPPQLTSGQKLSPLPTATRSGNYSFDGWYTTASGGTQITTAYTFSADTTVYAHWTYIGGGGGGGSYTPSYTVSVDKTENGTITVSPKSASKGDAVTITVKPDKGYELDTLKVLDKNGDKVKLTEKNGKYTFTMPTGKVTVKGSFVEEAPVQIFKDVPVDAYYYEAVKWAAEKDITGGVGNGLFAPNQPCTRAQIVTFLWRAAGSPAPKHMSSFTDVPADAFYAKAVAWAVENGITGGTGDGKFSPDATCTRAQSVTFLYRAAGSPKVSGSAEFGDVATNAYYADAVAWAAKNGITGGIGGGLFGSGNDCTRAQIVTFLYRNYQSK